jgi:prepilin-type N-terminal cleavage/methylation domain-containing protein
VTRRRTADQRGVTLIEVLVAVAILALTVGGISMATSVMTKGSGSANQSARDALLLTAFGEAIKALPYQPCVGPAEYQHAFDVSDAANDHDRKLSDARDATLTVVTVDGQTQGLDGCTPTSDLGTQRIELRVQLDDVARTGWIVKRDPDARPKVSQVNIAFEQRSNPGDAKVTLGLTALVDGSGTPVAQFEWYCDSSLVPSNLQNRPPANFTTQAASDARVSCSYDAPTVAGQFATPAVVTTDTNGEVRMWTGTYELSPTLAPHDDPLPNVIITSGVQCRSGAGGPHCTTTSPIRFQSVGSPVNGEAVIVKYAWNFGDGTAVVTCSQHNTTPPKQWQDDACPTGSNASTNNALIQSHTYVGGGSFQVTLTVTDSMGATGSYSLTVIVDGAPVEVPTIDFTMTPSVGVAPQTVAFQATSSLPVSTYKWDWNGSGVFSTSTANPTHPYPVSGSGYCGVCTVTLKVTATNGATNTISKTLSIGLLLPPVNLQPSPSQARAQAIGIWPFTSGHSASFGFVWFGPPRSPGDTISYEFNIRNSGTSLLCQGFGQSVNQSFTVASTGGAGAFQSHTESWSGSIFGSFVCKGNYVYKARTKRIPAGGGAAQYSAWTPEATVYAG